MRGLLLAMLLITPLTATADFDDGLAAALRGDFATALREWRPLAEQGHADAQYNLGVMYDEGEGVSESTSEAMKWYLRAAEQGNSDAQYNLGATYDEGDGVPENNQAAAKWYRLSADQGDSDAQFNLGAMYYAGEGVPQDIVLAHMWFNLAAAGGDSNGAEVRAELESSMTASQVAEAQRLTREWRATHPQ